MNETDVAILEMYFKDGMKEREIAKSLGISLLAVHESLAAYEDEYSADETEEDKA